MLEEFAGSCIGACIVFEIPSKTVKASYIFLYKYTIKSFKKFTLHAFSVVRAPRYASLKQLWSLIGFVKTKIAQITKFLLSQFTSGLRQSWLKPNGNYD